MNLLKVAFRDCRLWFSSAGDMDTRQTQQTLKEQKHCEPAKKVYFLRM